MLIPRYGTDPVIVLDGDPSAIAEPAIRQRRRLAALLAGLDDEQWAHPSRCAGWSSRDVIRRGEPTTFLATFDPVASPVQLVNDAGAISYAETLERFTASTEVLARVLESLDSDGWTTLAEAPPGHIRRCIVAGVRSHAGSAERGTLAVDVTEPDVSFVVEVDDRVSVREGRDVAADVRFTGNAVELLEALSFRCPLDQVVPDESAWMLRGLADTFDVTAG